MIRFLAVECDGRTYSAEEIAALLARVVRLERAIEAEWAAWYMYDSDPLHQEAELAHLASAALWALIGKEPAP